MRWVGIFLVACVVLAALRVAIIALLIVLGLLFLWGLLFRTAETLGGIVLLVLLGWLQRYPIPGLLFVGVLAVVSIRSQPGPMESASEEPKQIESAQMSKADADPAE